MLQMRNFLRVKFSIVTNTNLTNVIAVPGHVIESNTPLLHVIVCATGLLSNEQVIEHVFPSRTISPGVQLDTALLTADAVQESVYAKNIYRSYINKSGLHIFRKCCQRRSTFCYWPKTDFVIL